MQKWLLFNIAKTVSDLRTSPPHKAWLDHQLDTFLWYWSVDRAKNGVMVRDAIAKNGGNGASFDLTSYTHRAREAHQAGASKLIVREHVVPKKQIRKMLLETSTDEAIELLLRRYCFVCYVHSVEDGKLSEKGVKSKMPSGWEASAPLLERDPWARYRHAGLIGEVVRHLDAPPY